MQLGILGKMELGAVVEFQVSGDVSGLVSWPWKGGEGLLGVG